MSFAVTLIYVIPHFNYRKYIQIFLKLNYNHFHNILRLVDVLPKFAFTTSETMHDYYL